MIAVALAGLATGLAMIVAVGAQNAYLLRQGLRREHVGALIGVCMLSDIVLLGAATAGLGAAVDRVPDLMTIAAWAGGAFLVGYGALSLRNAARGGRSLEGAGHPGRVSATRAALTMAAVTWLNPHVYLDTLVLSAIANGYGGDGRWYFYGGLLISSLLWFLVLGYGSSRLSRVFARERAWRVLDLGIGVVMIALGVGLVIGGGGLSAG